MPGFFVSYLTPNVISNDSERTSASVHNICAYQWVCKADKFSPYGNDRIFTISISTTPCPAVSAPVFQWRSASTMLQV